MENKICGATDIALTERGKSGEKLAPYAPGAEIVDAKLLHSADEARSWVR